MLMPLINLKKDVPVLVNAEDIAAVRMLPSRRLVAIGVDGTEYRFPTKLEDCLSILSVYGFVQVEKGCIANAEKAARYDKLRRQLHFEINGHPTVSIGVSRRLSRNIED